MRVIEVQIAEYIDEVVALLRDNWDETGFDFPLEPDVSAYVHLQSLGAVFALAAFEAEQIIGYSTAFIAPHHFNPDVVMCHTDALFVAKAHRGGSAGARLIAATEDVARARGAHRICWHTRAGTALADVLSRRPGYRAADVVVVKELEHGD